VIYVFKLNFQSIQGVLIPVLGLISVASALYFYRIGWIKKEDIE